MIGLGRRGKIIGVVYPLLMEIHMDVRVPPVKFFKALPALGLGKPCPVPVQVKHIVVTPARPPAFVMFPAIRIYLERGVFILVIPVYISVSPVRVDTGVHNHHRIFQVPLFGGQ